MSMICDIFGVKLDVNLPVSTCLTEMVLWESLINSADKYTDKCITFKSTDNDKGYFDKSVI